MLENWSGDHPKAAAMLALAGGLFRSGSGGGLLYYLAQEKARLAKRPRSWYLLRQKRGKR